MAIQYNAYVPLEGLVAYFNPSEERGLDGDGTNVVTNLDLSTWSNGYNTSTMSNSVANPPGVPSTVMNWSWYDANTDQSGYVYNYNDFVTPMTHGALYRVRVWIRTKDKNFNISMYTADNAETGRVNGDNVVIPNDQEWYRASWTFRDPANSQSNSLSFNFSYGNPQGENQRTWMCYPYQEKLTRLVDLSGAGNHGTLGSTIDYSSWRKGHLLTTFADTTSTVSTNMILGSTFPVESSWTWTCWAKVSAVPPTAYNGVLIGATSYGGAAIYWYSNGSTVIVYGHLRQTSASRSTTTYNLTTNQWYHLTMVNSSSDSTFKLYVNGALVGSTVRDSTDYNNNGSSLNWGISLPQVAGGGSETYRCWPGYVGKTMLYSNEFTATQVAQHYNAQRGFYGV